MQAYASVQLNADLGLSDYVYGLGSGIFFLGYMVFQVEPSLQCSYLSPHIRPRSGLRPRTPFLAARPLHADALLSTAISQSWAGCVTCFRDPESARCGLQIPSQLVAERVGLPYWIGFLMVGWGITATLMAGLTSNPVHLYLLRFFLGEQLTPCSPEDLLAG